MPPIITIRPQAGSLTTAKAGKAIGLDIIGAPLSHIRPCDWDAPDPSAFDALLIGSANAIHFGSVGLAGLINLPVHAVGETTAQAARDVGFVVSHIGTGGLQGVLDAGAGGGSIRYLRLAGAEHIALNMPDGMTISTRILYENVVLSMPIVLQKTLVKGGLVLLHSAAAAEHFLSECERFGLDRSLISLAALGPRIEKAAGKGWAQARSAEKPDEGALLALASQMCHEAPYI